MAAEGVGGTPSVQGAGWVKWFEIPKRAEEFEKPKWAEGFDETDGAQGFDGAEGAQKFEGSEGVEGCEKTEESDESGAAEAGEPKGPGDDFEERLTRVTLWLKKIYGDRPIPVYEVNERTVDILHGLMERSEARDGDVSLLIEEMKHQETEYEAATKEMQDILEEDLGLSLNSLSRKATRSLNDLIKCAMILETKDTSLTSFFCAINDMTSELFETESKNREMQRKLNTLKKKLTAALTMEKRLQKDIKNIEENQKAEIAKIESRSHNLKFLRDKSLELKIRIRNAEKELIARGLDRSLTHDALVQLSEELVPLQEKVTSLKKEVQNYHDLPPSIPLARVVVEEEKQKLNALQEELSKELDKLSFELT